MYLGPSPFTLDILCAMEYFRKRHVIVCREGKAKVNQCTDRLSSLLIYLKLFVDR